MIAIFDLDGTLALNEHRQHFLEEKPENWKAFEEACVDDKPNMPIIQIYQNLNICIWDKVYIFSGRSEDVKDQTFRWLVKYELMKSWDIHNDRLRMRKSGDYRDDREVKKEMFEDLKNDPELLKLINEKQIVIFDDRRKVVDMWREMGLVCCQVAPGDF